MPTRIKFALAAGLAIGLTSAAVAMPEVPENKIDHRYPFLAVMEHPSAASAFASADHVQVKPVTRGELALFERATGRGW